MLTPQLISQQKMAKTYDYIWSFPVPRTTAALATLTVSAAIALPGMIVSLLVAVLRYDLTLDISTLVVPAILLTVMSAASIGYAMAHAIPNPMTTQLITQVLIFFILSFSPINFPPEQLSDWLAAIHLGLPFHHMAVVVRAGLVEGLVGEVGRSFAVLGAWAIASWLVTAWVPGRRR